MGKEQQIKGTLKMQTTIMYGSQPALALTKSTSLFLQQYNPLNPLQLPISISGSGPSLQ
jgi:hypothetical protein